MVRCKKCGLIYSNPILSDKYIKDLYIKAGVPLHEDLVNATDVYYSYLKDVLKNLGKNVKILDIGCGNGFFLSKLINEGYKNVYGLEPSSESTKKLATGLNKKQIKNGLYDRKFYKKNFFDLICFFQVFDHLTDPNKFLRDTYYNLKPGGYIFALNHNTDALSLKLLKENSPIIDVQHIYLFNKNNFRKIIENNKYEVLKVFTTISKYSLHYWFQMGPFPKIFKKLADRYKTNSTMKISIPFPAGNMAIIAQKPI